MRRTRVVALSLLAMIIVPALVVISPMQASAATVVDPLGPPMVNVLPSTIKGAVSGMSVNTQMMSGLVYKMAMDPKLVQAYINLQAGSATAAEVAQTTAAASKFTMFATKIGPLVKVAGPVGAAFTSYQVGTLIGGGVASLVGIDANNAVCTQTHPGVERDLTAFFAGQTCAPLAPAPDFEPNTGVSGGVATANVCPAGGVSGLCYSMARLGSIYSGSPTYYCGTSQHQGSDSGPQANALGGAVEQSGPYDSVTLGATSRGSANDVAYFAACTAQPDGTILFFPTSTPEQNYFCVLLNGVCSGEPHRATAGSSNPSRVLQCKITFTDGTSAIGSGNPFTETDPVFQAPSCPGMGGKTPSEFQIIEHADGGDADHVLSEMPTTPEYQQQTGSYPECSTGSCRLDLVKNPGTSCFVDVAACADWFTEPTKNDDYQCKYGVHIVSLTECTVYAPAFKQQNITKGSPLGDPTTGEPLSSPTKTGTDKDAYGSPIDNPDADRQCFPTGWGVFNPVEWVMKPVQCAMQWAFVPSPKHIEAVKSEMDNTYKTSPFGKAAAAVAAIHFPEAPTGCSGFDVDLSGWKAEANSRGLGNLGGWDGHVRLLAACDGDVLHPYAVGVSFILGGVFLFAGFRAVLMILSKVFGYSGPGAS